MNLTDCFVSRQQFPDNLVIKFELVFSDDDLGVVSKRMRATKTHDKPIEDYIREIRYTILKASREAERDLAYMRHGENWKKFVPWGGCHNSECRSEEEKNILDEAFNKVIEKLDLRETVK